MAEVLQPPVSEKDFQRLIVDYAKLTGWWIWHDNDSRGNEYGLPDLVLIKPPRVIFAELKGSQGRVRAKQHVVLDMLSRCVGTESYLVYPQDWDVFKRILDGHDLPFLEEWSAAWDRLAKADFDEWEHRRGKHPFKVTPVSDIAWTDENDEHKECARRVFSALLFGVQRKWKP